MVEILRRFVWTQHLFLPLCPLLIFLGLLGNEQQEDGTPANPSALNNFAEFPVYAFYVSQLSVFIVVKTVLKRTEYQSDTCLGLCVCVCVDVWMCPCPSLLPVFSPTAALIYFFFCVICHYYNYSRFFFFCTTVWRIAYCQEGFGNVKQEQSFAFAYIYCYELNYDKDSGRMTTTTCPCASYTPTVLHLLELLLKKKRLHWPKVHERCWLSVIVYCILY